MTDSPAHSVPGNSDQPPSIEEQRSELAETVSALAAKADIPTRVGNEASRQATRASDAVRSKPGTAAGAVGVVVAAVLVAFVLRRRRTRKVFR
ncbi:DUF3618 domain-containing protein [Rhodococcus fascians]|nr:DUF3618 domain-containing protein [Rhodococcus fascians]MBY3996480.1 DUF3618 domain-containing protein [Rhodococcus fascians]MBY4003373.1 DUF3618 domain-containing protein [Rhodococcus fascians]MBY4008123.1 DUF3618 domain-containing protein [Rhodococcus fascians]MBY4017992.1 DUF3618 domain-containing protein [Rhodococcus fascians]